MSSCLNCGGLIVEPNTTYGWAGKWCYCPPKNPAAAFLIKPMHSEADQIWSHLTESEKQKVIHGDKYLLEKIAMRHDIKIPLGGCDTKEPKYFQTADGFIGQWQECARAYAPKDFQDTAQKALDEIRKSTAPNVFTPRLELELQRYKKALEVAKEGLQQFLWSSASRLNMDKGKEVLAKIEEILKP